MSDAAVETRATVFLDPAQISAIIADYFGRHDLTVRSVMYAVGPAKKGATILGGQAVGCLGASVTLDPACVAKPAAVPIPAAAVRTNWEDDPRGDHAG